MKRLSLRVVFFHLVLIVDTSRVYTRAIFFGTAARQGALSLVASPGAITKVVQHLWRLATSECASCEGSFPEHNFSCSYVFFEKSCINGFMNFQGEKMPVGPFVGCFGISCNGWFFIHILLDLALDVCVRRCNKFAS